MLSFITCITSQHLGAQSQIRTCIIQYTQTKNKRMSLSQGSYRLTIKLCKRNRVKGTRTAWDTIHQYRLSIMSSLSSGNLLLSLEKYIYKKKKRKKGQRLNGRLKRKQSSSSSELPVTLCTSHPPSARCRSWYGKLFLHLQWVNVSVLAFQYISICSSKIIVSSFFGCYSFWDYNEQVKHYFWIDDSCWIE